MTVWMALALLVSAEVPPEQDAPEDPVEFFGRLHTGVWGSRAFRFEATQASTSLMVRSPEEVLWSAGADLGVEILDHFLLFGTFEGNFARDIVCKVAGLSAGYRERAEPGADPSIPQEATVYAGAIWGSFHVRKDGFGEFDSSFGVRVGLAFTWGLSRSVGVSALIEYRYITFPYKEERISGDSRLGGSAVWGGLGLDIHF